MAKKKKNIVSLVWVLALLLGVLAIVFYEVLNATRIKGIIGDDLLIKGWEYTFGHKEPLREVKVGWFAILPFIFLVLGTLGTFVGATKYKKFLFIAAGLLLVGSVLLFFTKTFVLAEFKSENGDLAYKLVKDGYKLRGGPIVGGIFGILAAGAAGCGAVAK
ncbi:MAG: hypothetical protein LBV55_02980 [Acholeplasmatales bacterium]|jgi:hypothetical protein|nr:hypothetical protein [Acholeplasmatales bacterium]